MIQRTPRRNNFTTIGNGIFMENALRGEQKSRPVAGADWRGLHHPEAAIERQDGLLRL